MIRPRAEEPIYIALAGIIGAGKTTLANNLAKEFNIPVFHEPVEDNPYLTDFYKNMGMYSFAMQMFLLDKRVRQQQRIVYGEQGGVQDRTIYEDGVFAQMLADSGHISARDLKVYDAFVQRTVTILPRPHVIVFLDVRPEIALKRIHDRGREGEQASITLEYLQDLHDRYHVMIQQLAKMAPVIRVDWSEFLSTEEVARRIHEKINEVSVVHEIKD